LTCPWLALTTRVHAVVAGIRDDVCATNESGQIVARRNLDNHDNDQENNPSLFLDHPVP
jgi:hypothetical protein